ncbi:MAG: DUF4105 domain-containing protein [Bacteroidota bacterium]|nr:DUF4105 domain-containing protein [Bacteroidota bacterium]
MQNYFLSWISVILCLLLHQINYGNNSPFSFDLEKVEISIITCDPGSEVYSLFGHGALRINHIESDEDIVVNWGIFEYYEDQFKFGYDFAKGRLNYYMGIQNTMNFLREYSYYNRGVREQILNLTTSEKKEIIEFVSLNNLPENRNYKYEFFYDNCSTRIRDLLSSIFRSNISWGNHPSENKFTFREIIHQNLAPQPWLMLGIDLVLGQRIDQLVNNKNLMFLPAYLEAILDSTKITTVAQSKTLISRKNVLIPTAENNRPAITSITIYGWIVLMITLLLLFLKNDRIFNVWSCVLLTLLSLLGVVLYFMWFGTDHQATKNNSNILWANPSYLFLVWVIIFKKWNKVSLVYVYLIGFCLLTTILFWFGMVQEFNPTIKPIIISLALIFYYYFRKNKFVIYNENS